MANKYIVLVLLILTLYSVPYSYVGMPKIKEYAYNGFNNDFDFKLCYDNLDRIPEEYLKDVRSIKFFAKSHPRYEGSYWWYIKSIHIYDNCRLDVLIHELAHHCQHKLGDTFRKHGLPHTGHFDECEDEIWEKVRK